MERMEQIRYMEKERMILYMGETVQILYMEVEEMTISMGS
jgi:hypothetical protein